VIPPPPPPSKNGQQTKPTAHITIHVGDIAGAFIPKAHVEVLDVPATFTKKLDSDDRGDLSIDLPIGTYEVTATYPAFKPAKKRIEVQDTTSQTVRFMLNVAIGGPTVEVFPAPSGLEPTKPNQFNSQLPVDSVMVTPPTKGPEKPSYSLSADPGSNNSIQFF
jgi:Carboxypeptidase regulatory-like domain